MDTLANVLDHADTLVLVLPGSTERFSEPLQEMLKRMTLMFGQNWWDFVVIGVSFWAYDQDSIDDRVCSPDYPDFCKDEEHFAANINSMMQKYFGLDKNFTFVFTDSWSQTAGPPGFNTDDPLQQNHWQEETAILWELTVGRKETFPFMTIDDILEENARMRAEIKWLNDVITNNISELAAQMEQNNAAIAANQLSIQDNSDNLGLVSVRVIANEAHIATTNLRIDENTANDNALETYLTSALHPVGKTSLQTIWIFCFIHHEFSSATLITDQIPKVQSLPGLVLTDQQQNFLLVGSFAMAPTSTGVPWKVGQS